MDFKIKYQIKPQYLPTGTRRRGGQPISPSVKFIVAHDTGNSGSTALANVSYYSNSANEMSASAHLFVDDKEIIECVPALTARPEKAWHVLYDLSGDNQRFGFDANDAAVGVEYCFGPNINADAAYARYVWLLAYLCYRFQLNPLNAITGHYILDPGRKTDPVSGLAQSQRTFAQLVADVKREYDDCLITNTNPMLRLIKIAGNSKVYVVGSDNKKYWVFNETTFNTGREMGLWGDWSSIENVSSDSFIEGHAIILVK